MAEIYFHIVKKKGTTVKCLLKPPFNSAIFLQIMSKLCLIATITTFWRGKEFCESTDSGRQRWQFYVLKLLKFIQHIPNKSKNNYNNNNNSVSKSQHSLCK